MKKHRLFKKEEILGTIVVKKGRLFWGDKELKIAAEGEPGEPGKTPVKGKDYFDGKTPVKGVDYFDGEPGKTPVKGVDYDDGRTPVKGVDYRDGEDGKGKPPDHQSDGERIRFQKPDGSWGRWIKIKGKPGEPGKTPVKGKDYSDGKTPVKGVDYRDGKTPAKGVDYDDGKDGYTPKKGKDYFDGEPGKTPVKGKDYFDGKDAKGKKGDPGIAPNDLAILVGDVQKLKKRVADVIMEFRNQGIEIE